MDVSGNPSVGPAAHTVTPGVQVDLELCVLLNRYRDAKAALHPSPKPVVPEPVLAKFFSEREPPSAAEGFAQVLKYWPKLELTEGERALLLRWRSARTL